MKLILPNVSNGFQLEEERKRERKIGVKARNGKKRIIE
jgi:hypothetical protein